MVQDVDVKIQVRSYLNFDLDVLKHAFFPWIITITKCTIFLCFSSVDGTMATCSSSQSKVITKDSENGLRARLLLDLGLKRLLDDFHSIFSGDPSDLYKALLKHQPTFETHRKSKKKILKNDQYDLLLPNDGLTYSSKFDITLLFYLLRTCCNLTVPKTGWKKEPKSTNNSKEANYVRIKNLRNYNQHKGTVEMTDQDFTTFYDDISKPLLDLGCNKTDIMDTFIM